MTTNLAVLHDQLRRDTAKMLNYDLNNLSAAEAVRLDRAMTLRLELDDFQTKKLSGMPVDVSKFIAASESLERLVGGNPDGTATPDFSGAKAELLQLLGRRAEGIERALARDPDRARAALEERIADAIAKHGNGDAPRRDDAPLAPTPTAVASPPPVEPVSSPPPRRPGNVVPLDANSRKPPDHYLAEHQHRNEPWRNGPQALCAPAWSPPDERKR